MASSTPITTIATTIAQKRKFLKTEPVHIGSSEGVKRIKLEAQSSPSPPPPSLPPISTPNKENETMSSLKVEQKAKYFPLDHCLLFYLFEMQKSGRGWKCKNGRVNTRRSFPVFGDNVLPMDDLKDFSTLNKMKAQFGAEDNPYVFSCVVEGHLTAPATIFQLVIDLKDETSKHLFVDYYEGRNTTSCHYYPQWQWVDQIPLDVYNKWNEI